MNRLRAIWLSVHQSLWFLPTVIVLAAVLAAVGLVELQGMIGSDLSLRWPRLLGAGAEGARGMLAAIATSMITVAGVVFSITIVALSLASSQYSPRVLRNFMSDRPTQVVLGVFVAVFAYCLVVLRTIRGPEEGAFVPSLAVVGGVVMAFAGVGLLIYFIHHVASAIQVTSIITRVSSETSAAIDRQFPDALEHAAEPKASSAALTTWPANATNIAAPRTGYIVARSVDGLVGMAVDRDLVVRVLPTIGDFVIEGRPLLAVAGGGSLDRRAVRALLDNITIRSSRDAHHDPGYGMGQLVDIALRSLSPGIHDPATACTAIDHLGALLVRLAQRRLDPVVRHHEGRLRLIAQGPSFGTFVRSALGTVAHHAATHAEVYERLIAAIDAVRKATPDPGRRALLLDQLDELMHRTTQADLSAFDRHRLQRAADAARAGGLSANCDFEAPRG